MAAAITTEETQVTPPPAADGATPAPAQTGTTFSTERERREAALAKYKAAADEYPSTNAGRMARFRQADLHMALGQPKEAAAAYQQVVEAAGDGVLGQTARLGLAEAYAHAGDYERAISSYKEAAARTDGPVPVEGVLMQLARTYRSAGKTADAEQTFNRVVEEFPESPLSAEARRELDLLKEG
jgi:tetratricopeptide (TPR) repeat protein